jgi:hypothetical protein
MWLLYVHGLVVLLGSTTLLWSLGDGRAGNFMFDGGSIRERIDFTIIVDTYYFSVLYSSAVAMYMFSVMPSACHCFKCFTHTHRTQCFFHYVDIADNFASLPLPFINKLNAPSNSLPPFPATLKRPTLDLASSHLVCSVALTGVLVLQAGRWWAEQRDDEEEEETSDAQKEEKSKRNVPEVDGSKKAS